MMPVSETFFRIDSLARFVGIFILAFSLIIIIYSLGFMRKREGLPRYYLYIGLTLLSSLGAVFADNLILFIVFWGFLGLLLYLLISFGQKKTTSATAKKAFIIIGATDALMLLGLALVWRLAGSLTMSQIHIPLDTKLATWAYLCLAAGAFAKAGAMPFHTWVPDTAEDAPVPVAAFLPASLDKLLGIYFLVRLSIEMFGMSAGMNTLLMAVGSVTIVAGVMMALVQHDLKRLLGYHAVSQVGYMVLGIGTANPIGIAGGLFHMLNNAVYKTCLFLGGGAVESKAKTSDLDKLGGLGRLMPITFASFLISSLAISGVPPFNGFASKWMVYQGIIEKAKEPGHLWVVFLVAAFFGSALTLASFMKLLHSVFLGQPAAKSPGHPSLTLRAGKSQEVGPLMWVPQVVLALLCIVFGVFVWQVPLRIFIAPSVGETISIAGVWGSGLATVLLIAGLGLGAVIYLLGSVAKARQTDIFIGGEAAEDYPDMRVSGTQFYNTIKNIPLLSIFYALAERKLFDIYEVGTKIILGCNRAVSYLHNGVLPTYLAWCLLGVTVLFLILFK